MKKFLNPGRIIALGFLFIILIGTLLFLLPVSHKEGVRIGFVDAFFTATSAVCVTGLSTFDPGSTLSVFGQTVLGILIQLGGLGFACISIGIIMLTGQKILLKQRTLVKEALNYGSYGGLLSVVKSVLYTTLIIEGIGAVANFFVFSKCYPLPKAIGVSIFHSVSSFNNAGFDIFGNGNNLIGFNGNIALTFITALLIILGGIGFVVIKEVLTKRSFKKFTLHTKVVLTITLILLVGGTIVFKLTENYSWLDSFFMSTSTRTAGFSTVNLSNISNGGFVVYLLLMFIGASPSSTGGGIKTTTFFVVLTALYSYSSSKKPTVFKKTLARDVLYKAFIILSLGLTVVFTTTFLLCIAEPQLSLKDLLYEAVSAFATVGLSTGITPTLSSFGKIVIISTMFIGRIGPLTIASLWFFKKSPSISYAEDTLTLG